MAILHAIENVSYGSEADCIGATRLLQLWAMCGRLRVGKKNLHVAGMVGAAMCSAC